MKKALLLAMGGVLLLAGCGPQTKENAGIPATPKWKGAPYRLTFDTKEAKRNPAGITIPAIKFTANPDALESRVTMVVRYDSSEVKSSNLIINQVILAPFNISGAEGTLSADTMDAADKSLAGLLSAYCMKDKVKVSVALVRSSLSPSPEDGEIDAKRLSDWATTEVPYKNLKKGCPR